MTSPVLPAVSMHFTHTSPIPNNSISRQLSAIRKKIESLQVPPSVFLGIETEGKTFHVAEVGGRKKVIIHKNIARKDLHKEIVDWVNEHSLKSKLKVVSAGIINGKDSLRLGSRLWLEAGVVPYVLKVRGKTLEVRIQNAAFKVAGKFNDDNSFDVKVGPRNEVKIAILATIDEYQKTVTKKEFEKFEKLVERFEGKRLVFFSATPQGGGVALMRHGLLRLMKLLGVDVDWYVMYDRKEIFEITKTKFHNILQDVAAPDVRLTPEDKKILDAWWAENAQNLSYIIKKADVIVIDDPQPAGLIPHIRKINPKAKVVFRSHIHLMASLANKKGTPQHTTWSFIWSKIKSCDVFVSHPVKEFIPRVVPKKKVVLMPPTTDPLDGLNRKLNQRQMDYYMSVFNKVLLESNQTPVDPKRPYIIQVARFDPSKGIPDVIESYRKVCSMLKKEGKVLPQLVIAGVGSIDDPDGIPIYNLVTSLLRQVSYAPLAQDIKVARLFNYDQIMNALLRWSHIALQLSYKEGFEVKVSEALHKGKPVIAYKTGGIPLQIEDGVTGYLAKIGNTDEVAKRLYELLADKKLYQKMSKAAAERVKPDVFTMSNAINWLFIAGELAEKGKFQGNGRYAKDLIPDKL